MIQITECLDITNGKHPKGMFQLRFHVLPATLRAAGSTQ